MSIAPDPAFWRGTRVLVTGHTGFKGAWLCLMLERLGAHVTGISLPPPQQPNLFSLARIDTTCASHFADIRDADRLAALVRDAQPTIVFHLAAQALVRGAYREPVATCATNVMGTVHLLEALRSLPALRAAVMVTSDKVYDDTARGRIFREDDPLGGRDPYSASKAAAEILVASYRASFLAAQGAAIATARAGNVIGGGDWAEDRLLPDAVRAWQQGRPLVLRRPEAVRPWQHVLDPLTGYLVLAERLCVAPGLAGGFNFGPTRDRAATVGAVVEMARSAWGGGEVLVAPDEGPHETARLEIDAGKAAAVLGVRQTWTVRDAVLRTLDWYRRQHAGEDARALCLADIEARESAQ